MIGIIGNGQPERDFRTTAERLKGQLGEDVYNKYFGFKRKKKKQSPTNALTDSIKSYVDSHPRCKLDRINTTGIYDVNLGKYRTSGSTKGVADLVGLITTRTRSGWYFCVEVKYGKDTQSEVQKKRENEVIMAGGTYYIAKSFDSFKIFFDNLMLT